MQASNSKTADSRMNLITYSSPPPPPQTSCKVPQEEETYAFELDSLHLLMLAAEESIQLACPEKHKQPEHIIIQRTHQPLSPAATPSPPERPAKNNKATSFTPGPSQCKCTEKDKSKLEIVMQKRRESAKKHYEKNKEKRRAQMKEYQRKRRNDPDVRKKHNETERLRLKEKRSKVPPLLPPQKQQQQQKVPSTASVSPIAEGRNNRTALLLSPAGTVAIAKKPSFNNEQLSSSTNTTPNHYPPHFDNFHNHHHHSNNSNNQDKQNYIPFPHHGKTTAYHHQDSLRVLPAIPNSTSTVPTSNNTINHNGDIAPIA